jgi:hypothetical protein
VDSNHLKGANLAQRVYKTPLTTKSHFRYLLSSSLTRCLIQFVTTTHSSS